MADHSDAGFGIAGFAKRLAIAAVLSAGLSACGAGDVQLNGKVFDAIGGLVGSNGPKEVKLAARPGLVPPPNSDSLPAPGSNSVPDGDLSQIADADRSKVVDKAAQQAKQKEYCRVNYELPKQRGDNTVDTVEGPLGPCRPSAMGLVTGSTEKE